MQRILYLQSIGAHEAGHLIHALTLNRLGVKFKNKKENIDKRENLLKKFVGWAYDSIKNKPKDKTRGEFVLEISEYANFTPKETVTEAVADYNLNKQDAAPLSIAIWEKLKSAFESDEWINYALLSHSLEEAQKGKLDDFIEVLNNKAVMAWYSANKNKAQNNSQLRHFAEKLLADSELAAELEKINSTAEWENLLQSKIPNEKILSPKGEWTNEKIFETAKDKRPIQYAFSQLDCLVLNDSVKFYDEDSRRAVIKFLENTLHPVSMYSLRIVIGKALRQSLPFPPLHTVRATFTAYGVPSLITKFLSNQSTLKFRFRRVFSIR